jgi:uncharacterized protein
MQRHEVLWHCAELASSDHATLIERDDGYEFRGVAALPLEDAPAHIEYEIEIATGWQAQRASAEISTPAGVRTIELQRAATGQWLVDGGRAAHLDGCTELDLAWTPATNTIPMRRLDLPRGEAASITAAWIRYPELDVVANRQTYTRLAIDRWHYDAGEFQFEIVTDPTTGLVLAYGDDLWRAAATAFALSVR